MDHPALEKEVVNLGVMDLLGMISAGSVKGTVVKLSGGEEVLLEKIFDIGYDGLVINAESADGAIIRFVTKRDGEKMKLFAVAINTLGGDQ